MCNCLYISLSKIKACWHLAVVGDAGGRDDGVLEQLEADLAAQVVGHLASLPPLVNLGEHGRHLGHPRVALLLHLLHLKSRRETFIVVSCELHKTLVLSGRKLCNPIQHPTLHNTYYSLIFALPFKLRNLPIQLHNKHLAFWGANLDLFGPFL